MINLSWDESLVGSKAELEKKYGEKLNLIQKSLVEKTCLGNDFLEWLNWPSQSFYDNDYKTIQKIYDLWKNANIDTVIMIGIGGSYIGPKAGIDMLTKPFDTNKVNVIYASGLHTTYTKSLVESLKNKNWAIIVVSKSGTTFETAVNFRIYRQALQRQYGNEHNQRIAAVTDEKNGVLRKIADENKYWSLLVPDGIGGRYSSLTSVGLLAMKLAGINIDEVLSGWKAIIAKFKENKSIGSAQIYAAIRYSMLTQQHRVVEVFNTYENNLRFIGEHYKQIIAESEGKTDLCLIPTLANHSEDLHSIGQLYQDGNNRFFETTLAFKKIEENFIVEKSSFNDDDNLDFLVGKPIKQLNEWIETSVKRAHSHIPNITIEMSACDAKHYGAIMAWMAIAAATSALLLDVNPFDQPGVEAYKAEMKKLIK